MGLWDRNGNLSIIRVGTLAAIIGVLFVVVGVVLFSLDRASHQVPLDIDAYPGATLWYQTPTSNTSRSVVYQIKDATADQVAEFYQNKMNAFNGAGDTSTCVRLPSTGNFVEFDRGQKDVAPYQYSCMFDRSGFQISQYTRVNIQPGIASNQTEGMVIVEYEQNWQP